MKNSLKMYIKIRLLNLFYPCWKNSGVKLTYVSDDFSEIHLKLPNRRSNRAPHGAIYGGALYACLDALPSMQIYIRLGSQYRVYDKEGTIQFKKPARQTLYARSRVSDEEIQSIKLALEKEQSIERSYTVDLMDDEGIVHVSLTKVIHMARRTSDDTYTHVGSRFQL